ncbi:MAG: hypothetical protein ACE5EC_06055, partial [Phycisphaerae bacterium]
MKTDMAPTEPEQSVEEEVAPRPKPYSFAMRRWIISLVSVWVLLVAGVLVFQFLWKTRPVAVQTNTALLPPRVEVQTLAPENIREVFIGYGSARADHEAT